MRVRVLDLDGAVTAQERLLNKLLPEVHDLRRWGPSMRLGCRWPRFHRFERWLDRVLGGNDDREPSISFVGSGDFRHLTLALLRRLHQPVNLLVLDNHPCCMRRLPFLHRANWLLHAASLPNVTRIFHVGGDACHWFAPSSLVRTGKIVLLPAVREISVGAPAVRVSQDTRMHHDRLEELLLPHLEELERRPLYISLNKDVMWLPESVVNGDSGHFDLGEVQELLNFFLKAAGNELLGMDVVGDWSPVQTHGWFRALLARFERVKRGIDPNQARLCNERTNTMLLRFLLEEPATQRGDREIARR